ncbi:Histone deacetylase complex subunit SAP30 SAP30 [Olea europaea subsp. europaea]|uniref:Histone deacetylase complex subunit SAP30 SAP30 n=1 Tax=Olea europaea subsp. europaea TaxID=158383 RepID=A0A8S0SR51_OLEEU|nr:Histone deacetylase complex subunit SAP30 SAP30 [Olea europaea subsp. europaea]
MLEAEVCSSRILSPFREESCDEELSVLPRHTKVIVTGNNRTKSVLVGLQGVVKKAVGLGGWHWLVLKNGVEVKLQRNALSVLEPPTGNEEDDDYDFEDSSSGSEICHKDNHRFSTSFQFGKLSKPRIRYSRPWSPTSSSKSINRISCREVQSKCQSPLPASNIHNPTKEQLVNAVEQHFSSQEVDDVQVIVGFIRAAAKRLNQSTRTEIRD